MYMPGRFRTASRPSSTVMSLAPYSRDVAVPDGAAAAASCSTASATSSTAGISALSLATGAFDSSMFVEGRPLPLPWKRLLPTGTSLTTPGVSADLGIPSAARRNCVGNGLSQRFTGAQLSTPILSCYRGQTCIAGRQTGGKVPLGGRWLPLQGIRGPALGFLYDSGAFKRPTRRLRIFQGFLQEVLQIRCPPGAGGYPYVSRGPRPLTVRRPLRQLGAAG